MGRLILKRNGVEFKTTDRCPLVTVRGKPYCLDKTCDLKKHCKYRDNLPSGAVPDLLIGMGANEFLEKYEKGIWDSTREIIE